MNLLKKIDYRWIWIGLGVLMILLRMILSHFPQLVETVYSRGLFQIIRYVNDFTLSMSPIPLLYVFVFLFIGWRVYKIRKNGNKSATLKVKTLQMLFSTMAFFGAFVFFFVLLWGFNYSRIPLEKQLKINPVVLSDEELKEEFKSASNSLFEDYFNYEKTKTKEDFKLADLENNMRESVVKTLQNFGYPTPGKVRARLLKPKGLLLRISTAGVYLPWVSECHVDAGLHPIQIPNVMAHELAHGYGITDEGSCNFIALQTCLGSNNLFYKYSGSLSYWKTVASNYRRYFPKEYEQFRAEMPPGILADIKAINDNLDKYPDIFPDARNSFYNNFLKSQGIAEGIKNYSRVIKLQVAFKKEYPK